MHRMIFCNLEHAEFPETDFIGFVRLEKIGGPFPVKTARSKKDFVRVDPKGKFAARKVQPRPSPK